MKEQNMIEENRGFLEENAYVIQELTGLREEHVKHFLMSDGRVKAAVYDYPVHVRQGDGWADMADTAEEKEASSETGDIRKRICMKRGALDISFAASSEEAALFRLESGNGGFSMKPAPAVPGAASVQVSKLKVCDGSGAVLRDYGAEAQEALRRAEASGAEETAAEAAAGQIAGGQTAGIQTAAESAVWAAVWGAEALMAGNAEALEAGNATGLTAGNAGSGAVRRRKRFEEASRLDHLVSAARYEDVYENADLEYVISPAGVKENIIVKEKRESYCYAFALETGNFAARQEEDGTVAVYDPETGKTQYRISAPYMTDGAGVLSTEVSLTLCRGDGGDMVTVTADAEWINAEDRVLPVKIDPTVTAPSSAFQIYCRSQNAISREPRIGNIHKTYLHFPLPAIPDSSRVTKAELSLYQLTPVYMTERALYVYRISGAFPESLPSIGSLPAVDNSIAEGCAEMHQRAYYNITIDLTNLARKWYDGMYNNEGIYLESANPMSRSVLFSAANPTPAFTVTYVSQVGLEPQWSTHPVTIEESAGTGFVKDFTGEFLYVHPDVSTNGLLAPVGISHVYNGVDMTASNPYGRGWTLSEISRIEAGSADGTAYYKYIDGDGTVHYYKDAEDGTYESEENPRRRIHAAAGKRYLADLDSNITTYFDDSGYPSKIVISANEDTEEAPSVTYTYGSNHRLERIDAPGRQSIRLTYDSGGYLESVQHYAGSIGYKQVQLYYESGTNVLKQIQRADGTSTYFTYDSSSRITQVKHSDRRYVQISYTNGKAAELSVYASDDTLQHHLKMQYHFSHTVAITKYGSSTEELKRESIQFDSHGRTVNITNEKNQYALQQYDGEHASWNQVHMKAAGSSNVHNLVKNGSAEYGTAHWSVNGEAGTTGSLISADNTGAMEKGMKCFLVTNATENGSYYASQAVSITPGRPYTISCYAKSTAGTPEIRLGFRYQHNGSSRFAMRKLTVQTEELISYTHTFPESGVSSVEAVFGVGGEGSAAFDCVQMEAGGIANGYNFLENSRFDQTPASWSNKSWGGVSSDAGRSGSACFYLKGSPREKRRVYQEVKVGGNGNRFITIGGWAKAHASAQGTFQLRVEFYYNGTKCGEEVVVPFDPYMRGWQYASRVAVVSSLFNTAKVYLEYDHNINKAYFEDLYFHVHPTASPSNHGTVYVYDGQGRVTGSYSSNGAAAAYTYDRDHTLKKETIKPAVGPITEIFYEYDSYKRCKKTTAQELYGGKLLREIVTENTYPAGSRGQPSKTEVHVREGTDEAAASVSSREFRYSTDRNQRTQENDVYHNWMTYTYNGEGLLTAITDPKGNETTYTHDSMGRLTKVCGNAARGYGAAGAKENQYHYAAATGYLSHISTNHEPSQQDLFYTFGYDANGEVSGVSVGSSAVHGNNRAFASYAYSGRGGALSQVTYGNGVKKNIAISPGEIKTVVSYEENGVNETAYTTYYDDLGTVTCTKDAVGDITTEYTADPEGRPLYVSDSRGNQAHFVYDFTEDWRRIDYQPSFESSAVRFTYIKDHSARTQETNCAGSRYLTKQDCEGRTVENRAGSVLYYKRGFTYETAPYGVSTRVSAVDYRKVTNQEEGVFAQLPTTLVYTYDENGLIQSVTEKQGAPSAAVTADRAAYTYDAQGQLIRENNTYLNETITYSYDLGGNLTEKKHFGYTESENISTELIKTDTYTYDSTWKDLLTGYHGGTIQYDGIGNPTAYLGKSLAWSQGRRLKSVDGTVSYGYDESGLRTSKTENGVKTEYFWLGKRLMSEWRSSGPAREFVYWYDENGEIVGFRYNGELYYYVKNLQGDVIGILDSLYQVVARYTYDTWGKLMGITDENGNSITAETHVAYLNPIRYRGYYYDNETGWYYLQSRYYDPEVGRFLNADGRLNSGIGYLGLSLYTYCNNNPVNMADYDGKIAIFTIFIAASSATVFSIFMYSGSISEPRTEKVSYHASPEEAAESWADQYRNKSEKTEYAAHIFSKTLADGRTVYFYGTTYKGYHHHVVNGFIFGYIGGGVKALLSKDIKMVGYIHTHPKPEKEGEYNEAFSSTDKFGSKIPGITYMYLAPYDNAHIYRYYNNVTESYVGGSWEQTTSQ